MSRVASVTLVALVAVATGVIPVAPHGGLIGPPLAQAQYYGERSVSGTVFNAKSQPINDAIVFLQNMKTKTIRSYTSNKEGHFNFTQVNMTEDYSLWAEKSGKKSAVKVVSSWDARKKWVGDLTIK
jgi:hypothetical protein